jgi:hypothetical protein
LIVASVTLNAVSTLLTSLLDEVADPVGRAGRFQALRLEMGGGGTEAGVSSVGMKMSADAESFLPLAPGRGVVLADVATLPLLLVLVVEVVLRR